MPRAGDLDGVSPSQHAGGTHIKLIITAVREQNPAFLGVHYVWTLVLSNCLITVCFADSFHSMR